eukprot:scaffold3996_cov39-Phaeocystis_antarctica.AAC.1
MRASDERAQHGACERTDVLLESVVFGALLHAPAHALVPAHQNRGQDVGIPVRGHTGDYGRHPLEPPARPTHHVPARLVGPQQRPPLLDVGAKEQVADEGVRREHRQEDHPERRQVHHRPTDRTRHERELGTHIEVRQQAEGVEEQRGNREQPIAMREEHHLLKIDMLLRVEVKLHVVELNVELKPIPRRDHRESDHAPVEEVFERRAVFPQADQLTAQRLLALHSTDDLTELIEAEDRCEEHENRLHHHLRVGVGANVPVRPDTFGGDASLDAATGAYSDVDSDVAQHGIGVIVREEGEPQGAGRAADPVRRAQVLQHLLGPCDVGLQIDDVPHVPSGRRRRRVPVGIVPRAKALSRLVISIALGQLAEALPGGRQRGDGRVVRARKPLPLARVRRHARLREPRRPDEEVAAAEGSIPATLQ